MKKTLFVLFVLVYSLFSSMSWADSIDDLISRNGIFYKKYTDIPFTGSITGKLNVRVENGKFEGLSNRYYDGGQLKEKGAYRNGRKTGLWEEFSEGGQTLETTAWMNDSFITRPGALNPLEKVQLLYQVETRDLQLTLKAVLGEQIKDKQVISQQTTRNKRLEILLADSKSKLINEKSLNLQSKIAIDALNTQLAEVRLQLNQLQSLFEAAETKDLLDETKITNLTNKLNAALARVVAEQRRNSKELKKKNEALKALIVQRDNLLKRLTHTKEITYYVGIYSQKVSLKSRKLNKKVFTEILNFDLKTDNKPEIYKKMLAEPGVLYRIVIAEGTSSWQTFEALRMADFLTGDLTKVPSEGSLAPTSYELTFGADRSTLIERMQREQKEILADAWGNRNPTSPLKTPEEALVLASLIEKETGLPKERKIVASVFVNRLRNGMKLQTDPAVIYGLTKGTRVLGRGLKRSELLLDTPFNTYINTGLPPTPIANPGKLAIQAALNPSQTNYLYFVANGSGGHAFAENLKIHNKNVTAWRSQNKLKADYEAKILAHLKMLKEKNAKLELLAIERDTAMKELRKDKAEIFKLKQKDRERLESEAKSLKKYRSKFFYEVKRALDVEGITVKDDRFVLSSEIFENGKARLTDMGLVKIELLSEIIRIISQKIPAEINWILRVDGHTNNIPLSGQGIYKDNWELSQARALSVVKYMSEEIGIPAARLAAAGFGEHHPIYLGNTEFARAKNRRIEIRLTER